MHLCINGDIMEDKKINPLLTGSAETMLPVSYTHLTLPTT